MSDQPPRLTPPEAVARFAGHVAAGIAIFLLVALPAVGIHILVHAIEWPRDMIYILFGIQALEYAIFVIDGLTFLAYLIISAYRLIRELLR